MQASSQLSWSSIANKIQDSKNISIDVQKEIQQLVLREDKERGRENIERVQTVLRIKDGKFIPNFEQMFQRKRSSGKGRGPIRTPYLPLPPLQCAPNYTLIGEQTSNYTHGNPYTPEVEKFTADNKPSVANDVINFENQSSAHSNVVTGEISLASIIGYGSRPNENIFPGQGKRLSGTMTQIFYMGENNFRVIQASVRLSKSLIQHNFGLLDPGPGNSAGDGTVAMLGFATLDIYVFDPQTGEYKKESTSKQVDASKPFFTDVTRGENNSKTFSKLLGNGIGSISRSNSFVTGPGIHPYGAQDLDLTVNITYEPSTKPIYVGVTVEMFSIIMMGNEKNSGVVISCQNTNETTPVLTFTPQRVVLSSSPFKVQAMRLCGI